MLLDLEEIPSREGTIRGTLTVLGYSISLHAGFSVFKPEMSNPPDIKLHAPVN